MDGLGSDAEVRAKQGWAPGSEDLPNAWLYLGKNEMDINYGGCLAALEELVWIVSSSRKSSSEFGDLPPTSLVLATPFS